MTSVDKTAACVPFVTFRTTCRPCWDSCLGWLPCLGSKPCWDLRQEAVVASSSSQEHLESKVVLRTSWGFVVAS